MQTKRRETGHTTSASGKIELKLNFRIHERDPDMSDEDRINHLNAAPITSKQILDHLISIRHDLRPGDVGYITYLHGTLYARDHDWDHTFDAYVAIPLAEFARSHSSRERIWIVEREEKIAGSVAIVKFSDKEAQLRWLLLDPGVRGRGLGRRLVEDALDFCRKAKYSSVFLWTVSTLPIAAQLYQSVGFERTQELTHELWGSTVTEIRYELVLK